MAPGMPPRVPARENGEKHRQRRKSQAAAVEARKEHVRFEQVVGDEKRGDEERQEGLTVSAERAASAMTTMMPATGITSHTAARSARGIAPGTLCRRECHKRERREQG